MQLEYRCRKLPPMASLWSNKSYVNYSRDKKALGLSISTICWI